MSTYLGVPCGFPHSTGITEIRITTSISNDGGYIGPNISFATKQTQTPRKTRTSVCKMKGHQARQRVRHVSGKAGTPKLLLGCTLWAGIFWSIFSAKAQVLKGINALKQAVSASHLRESCMRLHAAASNPPRFRLKIASSWLASFCLCSVGFAE